jgi:hypothetical protein
VLNYYQTTAGCPYISTANDDKDKAPEPITTTTTTSSSAKHHHKAAAVPPLVRFTVQDAAATVYLLYDRNAAAAPAWIARSGFRLTRATVKATTRGALGQKRGRVFAVYALPVDAGAAVKLGSNRAEDVGCMYIVVVAPREVTESASTSSSATAPVKR